MYWAIPGLASEHINLITGTQPYIYGRQSVGPSNQIDDVRGGPVSWLIGCLLSNSRFSFRRHQFDYLDPLVWWPVSMAALIGQSARMCVMSSQHGGAALWCSVIRMMTSKPKPEIAHLLANEIRLMTWQRSSVSQGMCYEQSGNPNDDF